MNEQTQASVKRILDMFLRDEERHFEENDKPADHIYHDLLTLQAHMNVAPALLEAAQGVLDDEDNTGCEFSTVVSEDAIEKLRTAVEATNTNAQLPAAQAGESNEG